MILLISPYNPQVKLGGYLSPPLGVYRISSYLKSLGIDVMVYDPNLRNNLDSLYSLVSNNHFEIIGFSSYHPTLHNDLAIAEKIYELSPKSKLVLGGEASYHKKQILEKTRIKYVSTGLGEFYLRDLYLNGYPTDKPHTLDDFKTISLGINFDDIPYNMYWAYMENLYSPEQLAQMKGEINTVRLFTSNLCPMKCTFCSSRNFPHINGKQELFMLTPMEIFHLMDKVKKAHPETENIFLSDDDFMVKPQRVWDFFRLTKDLGVKFTVLGRIDKLNLQLLEVMKEGGVETISLGIESFSDRVLEDMGKFVGKDEIICTLHDILDVGITPLLNLIPYYPTTTLEDLKYTILCATEFMASGARVAYWDFVNAYEGSDIAYMDYEIEPDNFIIKGRVFYRKGIVLPQDPEVRRIALKLRGREKCGTQPQEALNFFKLNYEEMGESTERIKEVENLFSP